ncbi:MAG: hypothetical protein ABIQ86_16940 [Steroidobacteraceae bacterium]
MTTATIQQVRPAGARYEALLLALAAVCVIGVLASYVHQHGLDDAHEPIYDWQVSAFSTLIGADQAIYNALYTAKDDIPYLYEDINMFNAPGVKFRWPNLTDLQDALLPPFNKDRSWEQNGSLKWTLYEPLPEGEMQGSTMYLGTDGTQPQQGSFLLVIGHVHAGFRNTNSIFIWWSPKNHAAMPQSGFRDGLILQGWREVVPNTGAQEVKRIFGSDATDGTPTADQQKADEAVQGLSGDK